MRNAILALGIVAALSLGEVVAEPPRIVSSFGESFFTPGRCKDAADQIKREIAAAEACISDSDCVIAHFGCPFGCESIVNKACVDSINAMISKLRCVPCEFQCAAMGETKPGCRDGKCSDIAASPPLTEAPLIVPDTSVR